MLSHPFTIERGGKTYRLQKHDRDAKLPPAEQSLRPWYIRIKRPDGSRTWKKVGEHHETEQAVAAARALLIQARAGGNKFEQLQEATRYRASLTVGALMDQWLALGCPERNGRRRGEAQQRRQQIAWRGAESWWTARALATVNEPLLQQYAAARRATIRGEGDGGRSVDLELTTLANCCQWAVGAGHLLVNPFASRPRFHDSDGAERAFAFMPADDDELHRIISLLISPPSPGAAGEASAQDTFCSGRGEGGPQTLDRQSLIVAGAQLCFQALTGLRSGEPGFLRWDARRRDNANEPGLRYQGRQSEHLAVKRLKGGKNPAVEIHPALQSFLAAWSPFARATWPASPWMFPDSADPSRPLIDPEDGRKRLNRALELAVAALGLPERHPHSMRAFYVRVRRSQGTRDAVIAEELGQGSGPRQIEQSYGAPDDCYDDGLHDWLPSPAVRPCWELLNAPSSNLVPLTSPATEPTSPTESTLGICSPICSPVVLSQGVPQSHTIKVEKDSQAAEG